MIGWYRVVGILVMPCALGVAGCGGKDSSGGTSPFRTLAAAPGFPGTPGDPGTYASEFQYTPVPECEVTNPTDLGGSAELRIFRGNDVTDQDVHEFIGGLQRYYSQYGVQMSTRFATIDVPIDEAMIFDVAAVNARVKAETGIDISGSVRPEDEDRAVNSLGRAILFNVRELIRVYGEPRSDVYNVVLVNQMVSKVVPAELQDFRGIAGLGLSPELLAKFPTDDPSAQMYEWLSVDRAFTPLAIVGVDIVHQYLQYPDVIIAHEMGHAFGLTHVTDPGNLLDPGQTDCWLELDSSQLAEIRTAVSGVAHGAPFLEHVSLTSRAGEFVTSVRSLVHARVR